MLNCTFNLIRRKNRTFHFATHIIINSYNFYVDFKGLMYFDDGTPFIYPNCVKDIKFISNFYKNLRVTDKEGFQYEAEFWGEKNYLRSAISPVVFHNIDKQDKIRFSFDQKCDFNPDSLQIDREGRIWHPYRDQIKGVFSNDLLVNFAEQIQVRNNCVYFKHNGNEYYMKEKRAD